MVKMSMLTEIYSNLKQLDLPGCFVSVYHTFEMGRKLDIYLPLFSTIFKVPTTLEYSPLFPQLVESVNNSDVLYTCLLYYTHSGGLGTSI